MIFATAPATEYTTIGPPSWIVRVRVWQPRPSTATVAILVTALAYASASFFVRRLTDAGMPATTVAFARFAIVALVLARFVPFDSHRRTATTWGMGSGAAMAIGWIAYVGSVESGSVAAAGVAYMTYPLFAMVALKAVFGHRPTPGQLAGGLMVLAGAAVALGPSGSFPLIALAAPATFGMSIAILTERLTVLDPFERLGSVALGASLTLLPLVMVRDHGPALPTSGSTWMYIIALGVGSGLIPMLAYAAAAPRVGAARASVAGSLELPAIIAIGALLGESITVAHLIGTAIICGAIVLTSATRPAYVIPGEHLPEGGDRRPAHEDP